jgi:hypothetical protein
MEETITSRHCLWTVGDKVPKKPPLAPDIASWISFLGMFGRTFSSPRIDVFTKIAPAREREIASPRSWPVGIYVSPCNLQSRKYLLKTMKATAYTTSLGSSADWTTE